jgi:hypothetical protein
MSNMPSTIDHYDIVGDEDTDYVIGLLTAIPSSTWTGYTDFVQPTDPAYLPQTTTAEVDDDDGDSVTATLDDVVFDPSEFSTAPQVLGYYVAAKYDDGYIPLGIHTFAKPLPMTADQPLLVLGGKLTGMKTVDQTDILWS